MRTKGKKTSKLALWCISICLIGLFTPLAVAQAATYYVADPKGADGIAGTSDDVDSNDSYPGTLAQPFATIQNAANIVRNFAAGGTSLTIGDSTDTIVLPGTIHSEIA